MNILKETINRLSGETPKFFKKLQSLGAWLTATGLALTGVPAALNASIDTHINTDLLIKISSYMVLAGLIISSVSKLPVKDADYNTLDK